MGRSLWILYFFYDPFNDTDLKQGGFKYKTRDWELHYHKPPEVLH